MWFTTIGALLLFALLVVIPIEAFLYVLTEAIAVEHLPFYYGYVPEKKFGLTDSVILLWSLCLLFYNLNSSLAPALICS